VSRHSDLFTIIAEHATDAEDPRDFLGALGLIEQPTRTLLGTLLPHGTHAAYQRHTRRGETPCAPCREAKRRRGAQQRRRAGVPPRRTPPCGTTGGYARHRRLCEPPCQPCKDAVAARQRTYRQAA
jgi:hypothetical protein